MKLKHTPGPWHALVDETATLRDKDGQLAIFTHMKTHPGGRRDSAEVAANTRLCAAAPDMLDAVGEVLDVMQNASPVELTKRLADCYTKCLNAYTKAYSGAA